MASRDVIYFCTCAEYCLVGGFCVSIMITPELLDRWRILPRVVMFVMIVMTYRVVEWFMDLPDPNPEQAALVSVMTGALTGSFGLFLGSGKKE
mgnify:CR=1